MTPLPAGYTERPATRDDLPAIAAFLALCDLHDFGGTDFTQATIEMDWALPRFDPSHDTWLFLAPSGEIAAHGWMTRRPGIAPEASGWVHPDHRGRGLGSAMVDRTEVRALQVLGEPGATEPQAIVHWTNARQPGAAELLEQRGYHNDRVFWRMSVELGKDAPEPAVFPPGIELRPMRVGVDDRAVYDTVTTAFAEHWNYAPLPFDDWRRVRVDSPHFDPELWLLAWSGNRLIGAALDINEGGEAWIQTLAVRQEARGQGLGAALLRESFRRFHARGHRAVMLGVDSENATGATRLYASVGMAVDREWLHWERPLP